MIVPVKDIYRCLPADKAGILGKGEVGNELRLVSLAHWMQCDPSDPAEHGLIKFNVSLSLGPYGTHANW